MIQLIKNIKAGEALLALLSILFVVTGCSTPKQRIDPALMSESRDFTKPADVSGKSRAVYILPTIVEGWNPARVDQNGAWIGGHYSAIVTEPGHWATLEEAEISGKPFIRAGESKPVVPVPDRPVPSSPNGESELDISQMQARINNLEEKVGAMPAKQADDAFLMESATRKGRVHAETQQQQIIEIAGEPGNTADVKPPGVPPNLNYAQEKSKTPSPISVKEPSEIPEGGKPQSQAIEITNTGDKVKYSGSIELSDISGKPIMIPARPAGEKLVIDIPGTGEKLKVYYGQSGMVTFVWKNNTYRTQFSNEYQKIKLKQP